MVKRVRTQKKSRQAWNYFYLNGDLHKTLQANKSEDILVAWNFKMNKRVAYNLADAYNRRQRAYTTGQVARLVNRHIDTVKRHLLAGDIRKPQTAMSLDGTNRLLRYLFSEDDIREVREFFLTVHRGRPRHDGQITHHDIPSKAELEALLRNEKVLYTKNSDGEFMPIWKQPEW